MPNSKHRDTCVIKLVVDHVVVDGETANAFRDVRAVNTHERVRCNQDTSMLQSLDVSIRRCYIVLCDEQPYIDQVRFRDALIEDMAHPSV